MTDKPAIKIVQYFWGEQNTAYELGRLINATYCRRHGYHHIVKKFPPRPDRACLWEKLPAIRQELHHCDYLLYLDADAFFYSHELTVELELIPFLENKQILMAADIASETIRRDPTVPNSGVILIRCSQRAEEILRIWDESSERPELEHYRFGFYHEQEACWKTVWLDYADDFQMLHDYYMMNGYYGMYIRHLMAMPDEQRKSILQDFMQKRHGLFETS